MPTPRLSASGQDTPQPPHLTLGRLGESLAATHLDALGWRVLDRNWRCELGEIDLVAREGDTLVVCEVKTRRGTGLGEPVEAVTAAKLARLGRLAAVYAAEHRDELGPLAGVRIDVIGIVLPRRGRPALRHLQGVGS